MSEENQETTPVVETPAPPFHVKSVISTREGDLYFMDIRNGSQEGRNQAAEDLVGYLNGGPQPEWLDPEEVRLARNDQVVALNDEHLVVSYNTNITARPMLIALQDRIDQGDPEPDDDDDLLEFCSACDSLVMEDGSCSDLCDAGFERLQSRLDAKTMSEATAKALKKPEFPAGNDIKENDTTGGSE